MAGSDHERSRGRALVRRRRTRVALAALGALLATGLALSAALAGVSLTTYSTGTFAAAVPDQDLLAEPILVKHKGKVQDVDVKVRIDHPFVGDLQLVLVSPSGRVVKLSTNNGRDGDNYGSGAQGCEGNLTVFRDEAERPITDGEAPYDAEPYQPEEPLSSLEGSKVRGTWTLLISDAGIQDTGAVYCWQLKIRRKR